MDSVLERISDLETRTRRMEGQLRRWRITSFVMLLGVVSLAFVVPTTAQQFVGQSTFTAPFVVKGSNGAILLEVKEFVDRGRGDSRDTIMTFHRNGQPATMLRTTGLGYKDSFDRDVNFLNVFETWMYRYTDDQQRKITPTAYLATSTALTRGGGSFVVFNAQGQQSQTPPFAARITASRGVGGEVILYNPDGSEARSIQPR